MKLGDTVSAVCCRCDCLQGIVKQRRAAYWGSHVYCAKQGSQGRGVQRGRGRRRGRFHEEEESGMTLDEWEAQQKSKAASERLLSVPWGIRSHQTPQTASTIFHMYRIKRC